MARLPAASLEAYNYYLRAEQLTYRAKPASAADALHEKAIALDPEFAHACGASTRLATDVLAYGRERRAGFEIAKLETGYLVEGPGPSAFHYRGIARP